MSVITVMAVGDRVTNGPDGLAVPGTKYTVFDSIEDISTGMYLLNVLIYPRSADIDNDVEAMKEKIEDQAEALSAQADEISELKAELAEMRRLMARILREERD